MKSTSFIFHNNLPTLSKQLEIQSALVFPNPAHFEVHQRPSEHWLKSNSSGHTNPKLRSTRKLSCCNNSISILNKPLSNSLEFRVFRKRFCMKTGVGYILTASVQHFFPAMHVAQRWPFHSSTLSTHWEWLCKEVRNSYLHFYDPHDQLITCNRAKYYIYFISNQQMDMTKSQGSRLGLCIEQTNIAIFDQHPHLGLINTRIQNRLSCANVL